MIKAILLDKSASMAEPFQEQTKESEISKWEASVNQVLHYSNQMPIDDILYIIAYDAGATHVFTGNGEQVEEIKSKLHQIKPSGSTNISSAINLLIAVKPTDVFVQSTIITDGEEEPSHAEKATFILEQNTISSDVILIDPTKTGESFAKAISTTKNVFIVKSPNDLFNSLSSINELQKNAQQPQVQFTTFYPQQINPIEDNSIKVFIHSPKDKLSNTFQYYPLEHISAHPSKILNIPFNSEIWVKPTSETFEFSPYAQAILWNGKRNNVVFTFKTKEQINANSGYITINFLFQNLIISDIKFEINIANLVLHNKEEIISSSIYKSIYASCADKDIYIAQAMKHTYESIGTEVYFRNTIVKPGQQSKDIIPLYIKKSDIFQLYWSKNAANSKDVSEECQYAYSLMQSNIKPQHFIMPLIWHTPPHPLPELISNHQSGKISSEFIIKMLEVQRNEELSSQTKISTATNPNKNDEEISSTTILQNQAVLNQVSNIAKSNNDSITELLKNALTKHDYDSVVNIMVKDSISKIVNYLRLPFTTGDSIYTISEKLDENTPLFKLTQDLKKKYDLRYTGSVNFLDCRDVYTIHQNITVCTQNTQNQALGDLFMTTQTSPTTWQSNPHLSGSGNLANIIATDGGTITMHDIYQQNLSEKQLTQDDYEKGITEYLGFLTENRDSFSDLYVPMVQIVSSFDKKKINGHTPEQIAEMLKNDLTLEHRRVLKSFLDKIKPIATNLTLGAAGSIVAHILLLLARSWGIPV